MVINCDKSEKTVFIVFCVFASIGKNNQIVYLIESYSNLNICTLYRRIFQNSSDSLLYPERISHSMYYANLNIT